MSIPLSSTAATLGSAGEFVHYAASKAAVDAFTVGLAREVATQRIRVNAMAPRSLHTDIHVTAGEPTRPARVVSRIPMARLGEPEEVAEATYGSSPMPPPTRPARSCACLAGSDRS